jgi:hypothetical protein
VALVACLRLLDESITLQSQPDGAWRRDTPRPAASGSKDASGCKASLMARVTPPAPGSDASITIEEIGSSECTFAVNDTIYLNDKV